MQQRLGLLTMPGRNTHILAPRSYTPKKKNISAVVMALPKLLALLYCHSAITRKSPHPLPHTPVYTRTTPTVLFNGNTTVLYVLPQFSHGTTPPPPVSPLSIHSRTAPISASYRADSIRLWLVLSNLKRQHPYTSAPGRKGQKDASKKCRGKPYRAINTMTYSDHPRATSASSL